MVNTNIDIDKKYVKMKQDVYEHLAKTFLDKRIKKNAKKKNQRIPVVVAIILSFALFYILVSLATGKNVFSKSLYVISDKTPILIEYDFSVLGGSKTSVLSFNLNNINLSGFNFLEVSFKTDKKTKIDSTIKVKIENSFLEKDAQYLSGINNKWKVISLPLRNFYFISDWKSIKTLTFVVEDWNVSSNKGKIYIDDVRFIKR